MAERLNETTGCADNLVDIDIGWQGDFLFFGKIGIGFVGYDVRQAPDHFIAYLGSDSHRIGHFPTRQAAKDAIVRYIKEGPHVPF